MRSSLPRFQKLENLVWMPFQLLPVHCIALPTCNRSSPLRTAPSIKPLTAPMAARVISAAINSTLLQLSGCYPTLHPPAHLKYACFIACRALSLSSGLYASSLQMRSMHSGLACGMSLGMPVPSFAGKLKSMC